MACGRYLSSEEHRSRAGKPNTEFRDWYDYPDRALPELLVETFLDGGEVAGALTVNRYGATILNTARLAIVDVDLPRDNPGVGGLFRALFGKKKAEASSPRDQRIESVAAWVRAGGGRGARVYETAGGLRHILLGEAMDPCADDTRRVLRGLDADPIYARLCKGQRCYRARLTPKPWRVGMNDPHLNYEKLTSIDPGMKQRVDAWFESYEQASAGFGVCRLVETFGREPSDEITMRLVREHDEATIRGDNARLV
ncbi:MAG: hypothetical protein H6810_03830 [Phycisphaeraceae bacterium]|nr:MAG: hypothetical protein H6810_03830 [Phycisphaeraceae bacterium]